MAQSVIQPYFVLSTEKYYKAIMNNYGISHFYTFKRDALESADMIAVPDGCIDILFTCDEASPHAEICGSVLQPKRVLSKASIHYFGVRFYPGECIVDHNINIKEVIENIIPLTDVFDAEDVTLKVVKSSDFMSQVSIFLDFYKKQLGKSERTSDAHLLKNHMLNRIVKSKGHIKVKELAYEIGYTERHINNKFMEYFGMSPKVFSKIIRFQHVLNQLNASNCNSSQSSLIEIAQEAGYYDQSHMYKDFSEFANTSPGQYLDLLKQKDYAGRLIMVKYSVNSAVANQKN